MRSTDHPDPSGSPDRSRESDSFLAEVISVAYSFHTVVNIVLPVLRTAVASQSCPSTRRPPSFREGRARLLEVPVTDAGSPRVEHSIPRDGAL